MQHDEVLFVAVQTYQVLEAVDAFQLLLIRPSSTSIVAPVRQILILGA